MIAVWCIILASAGFALGLALACILRRLTGGRTPAARAAKARRPTVAEWWEQQQRDIAARTGVPQEKMPADASEADSPRAVRDMREYERSVLNDPKWERAGDELVKGVLRRWAGAEATHGAIKCPVCGAEDTRCGPVSRTQHEVVRAANDVLHDRLRECEDELKRRKRELCVFYQSAVFDPLRLEIVITRERVIDAGGGEVWRKIVGTRLDATGNRPLLFMKKAVSGIAQECLTRVLEPSTAIEGVLKSDKPDAPTLFKLCALAYALFHPLDDNRHGSLVRAFSGRLIEHLEVRADKAPPLADYGTGSLYDYMFLAPERIIQKMRLLKPTDANLLELGILAALHWDGEISKTQVDPAAAGEGGEG